MLNFILKNIKYFVLSVIIIFYFTNCQKTNRNPKNIPFGGAAIKAYNIKMLYSDSANIKIEMEAPLQLEYTNGNQEFPEGIKIIFFNEKKEPYNQITAKKAFYFKNENRYKGIGDVQVKNIIKKEEMRTEELEWTPATQKIFTDKFLTITTPSEILKGTGMTAKQDFSEYKITQPTGRFSVKK